MDCKQSEIAMMQHIEKTIKPKTAKELAEHLLTCKPCREYFMLFDEMAEYSEDSSFEILTPANDFTQSVMAKVNDIKIETKGISVLSKVFWGISAILMGVVFYLVANPELMLTFDFTFPSLALPVLSAGLIGSVLSDLFYQLTQLEIQMDESLGIVASFFALVLCGLVTLLYSQENTETRGVEIKA